MVEVDGHECRRRAVAIATSRIGVERVVSQKSDSVRQRMLTRAACASSPVQCARSSTPHRIENATALRQRCVGCELESVR